MVVAGSGNGRAGNDRLNMRDRVATALTVFGTIKTMNCSWCLIPMGDGARDQRPAQVNFEDPHRGDAVSTERTSGIYASQPVRSRSDRQR